MSLVLTTALVASTVTLPSCSWDRPGADPYMGDIPTAVDRYRDIPPETRAKLKQKMAMRAYDDIATITRDEIKGTLPKGGRRELATYSDLRDMHFGNGRICQQVGRTRWKPDAVERGLIYCADGHCLIVPTICRNVSRINAPLDFETAAGRPPPPPPPETPLEDFETAAGPRGNLLGGQSFTEVVDPVTPATIQSLPPGDIPPPPPPPPPPEPPCCIPPPPPPPPPPPIPEPSTYALMALGLAVVGLVTRRRRAVSRA
ncbi:MAG: MHFG family PEP-CTERM protein [Rubrivivax sp.]